LKVWEAAPVGLLAKMREGGLEIGGERLDYPAVVRHIKRRADRCGV
jgi:hypothetical protein